MKDEDLALMAQMKLSPEVAGKLVGLLLKQKAEFARLEEIRRENEEKRVNERHLQELQENATINWHAIISAALFSLAAVGRWQASFQRTAPLAPCASSC